MANANIQTPDWLQQREAIADDQLRVIFANEALLRLGRYQRSEIQGHTPDAIFPAEDIPYIMESTNPTSHRTVVPGGRQWGNL